MTEGRMTERSGSGSIHLTNGYRSGTLIKWNTNVKINQKREADLLGINIAYGKKQDLEKIFITMLNMVWDQFQFVDPKLKPEP
jgi:hypothetical protein